jgi:uncharacterized membrane protein
LSENSPQPDKKTSLSVPPAGSPRSLADQTEGRTRFSIEAAMYSGPLPPPQDLERYAKILKNAPERIFQLAEKEAANRQSLERWVVKSDVIRSILGVVSALLIVLFALGLGAYLVLQGHDVAGTIFAGAGLTGLVTTFIYGTNYLKKKDQDQDEDESSP